MINTEDGKPVVREMACRRASGGAKYSRLDSEVAAMQRNSATYCDEPADAAEFEAWLQVCMCACVRKCA